MPIPPAIPFGGLVGFNFLERTLSAQQTTFNSSPDIEREVQYFQTNAANVTTVDQLIGDRRLLNVVLTAFGLQDDLNKGAFVRKVIEEGTLASDAFANRLVDPAYREMANFLGFGDVGGTLIFESTRTEIVDRFRTQSFELAVGEQDLDLRLGLNFKREAVEIASSAANEQNMWLRLLGSQPIRQVIEGALFLPTNFALIDLDQQVEEVQRRASQIFGSSDPSIFADPANIDRFVDRFLLRQQTLGGGGLGTGPGSTALTLLQSGGLGAGAQENLFASNFL
ncbi:MAG: DUF1217 domain-containing protein [Pseudomonadota bacterium]